MEINKTNNLNFGTTIRVVSPDCFKEIGEKLMKNECEKVANWAIIPKYADDAQNYFKKIWLGYRINAANCYTKGVRSCVSGVVANKKANASGADNASLFMHIENTKSNIENLHYIKPYFEGTNAVLIGSKKHIEFSYPLFSKIESFAKSKLPTSILKGLIHGWETDVAYLSEQDVLYLTVKHIENKNIIKNI